jgi:hypothetical protein
MGLWDDEAGNFWACKISRDFMHILYCNSDLTHDKADELICIIKLDLLFYFWKRPLRLDLIYTLLQTNHNFSIILLAFNLNCKTTCAKL